jgi:hypothetical protein
MESQIDRQKALRTNAARLGLVGSATARRSPENSGIADYFAARKIPLEAEYVCINNDLYEI